MMRRIMHTITKVMSCLRLLRHMRPQNSIPASISNTAAERALNDLRHFWGQGTRMRRVPIHCNHCDDRSLSSHPVITSPQGDCWHFNFCSKCDHNLLNFAALCCPTQKSDSALLLRNLESIIAADCDATQ